ncbi:hypothetical protein [Marinisporobacter balticus]|uniref:Flagellar operon protein (TIGR03826 family) n=1 Tax=Marinisporobacter balticus TaxID=2018667 RepID=A0A4R2L6K5_9FIRM|nr:hypothetical protein [Marinisporobacter balticus]TCO74835.1 hypothetical protein EV214_11199 [Marinisporobacter balticus]
MVKNKGLLARTCKKCKKIIDEKSLYDYCPECFKKIEEVFEKIESYLKEYPGATAFEIEQETGVPYHIINNFVRDGRLIEMPNEYLNFECKRCGCLLLSAHHKYCPTCREELEKEMELAKIQLKQSMNHENAKMHIRHGENKRKK